MLLVSRHCGPFDLGALSTWLNHTLDKPAMVPIIITVSSVLPSMYNYNDLAISTTACRLHRDGDVFRLWDIRIRLFSSAGKPAD